MQEKNKYCCEDHVDMAFDDFLVENEIFPNLEPIGNIPCTYCKNEAIYVLKASSSMPLSTTSEEI